MEERRPRVFQNRVLRRILGPERDEVTGEWRKLHNGELHYLYCSSNIVRVIKSRVRWAMHVAHMGRGETCTGFCWESLWERDHWGDPGVDWRIMLRWIAGSAGVDNLASIEIRCPNRPGRSESLYRLSSPGP
jgi:hypothetical protein